VTFWSYVVGVVLLTVSTGPLAAAAVAIRRRQLPRWGGAVARLAEATITLLLLLGVLHVLGSVGLFRRLPVVSACAATGLLIAWLLRRQPPEPAAPPTHPPPPSKFSTACAIAVVAVVFAQWMNVTGDALRHGITDYDSLWYHLTHAARFVQDGWITRLHFTRPEFPSMFHPADNELLHAFGMLLFKNDALSPLVNLFWLAFSLGAAWCIGRSYGNGPLAVIAAAVLLGTAGMAALEPGSALNDVATICAALLVAAFLVQPDRGRGVLALVAGVAGFAIGTKLTMLAPVAVLTVGVVLVSARGERRAAGLRWLLWLSLTGSFWYLRNLVRAGSPLPNVRLGPLPSARFEWVERFHQSVADYIGNAEVWRQWLHPALRGAFGSAWWLILLLAVIAVTGVAASRRGVLRVLALVAVADVAAFVITPTSAAGENNSPFLFLLNLRYAYPGLVLAFTLIAVLAARTRQTSTIATIACSALFVVTEVGHHHPFLPSWGRSSATLSVLAAMVALLLCATAASLIARPAQSLMTASLAILLVGCFGAGYVAMHRYERARLSSAPWANGLHARVAVAGTHRQFLFYGPSLENHVDYLGTVGPHGAFHELTTCTAWRGALAKGRYEYVVIDVGIPNYPDAPNQLEWTRTAPGASLVTQSGTQTVFRLPLDANPAPC
jgi:hypothetical protein